MTQTNPFHIVADNLLRLVPYDKDATFTLFSSLPPEIRDRIWMFACYNVTRNICVRREYIATYPEQTSAGVKYGCRSIPPAVLHASKESRMEGLKHYALELEYFYKGSSLDPDAYFVPAKAYINWSVDRIVALEPGTLMDDFRVRERKWCIATDLRKKMKKNGLRYLAIGESRSLNFMHSLNPHLIHRLYPWGGNIEELIFFNSYHPRFSAISHTDEEAVPDDIFEGFLISETLDCQDRHTTKVLRRDFRDYEKNRIELGCGEAGIPAQPVPVVRAQGGWRAER
ncbi:hypothetical protein ACMFMG_003009 [Clarireedia jacksonii]